MSLGGFLAYYSKSLRRFFISEKEGTFHEVNPLQKDHSLLELELVGGSKVGIREAL